MKKTLVTILLSISGCIFAQRNYCPSDDESLRAGLFLYSVIRPALSNSNKKDIDIANTMYKDGCITYFNCRNEAHVKEHSKKALQAAFEYLNIPETEREEFTEFLNNTYVSN